MSPSTFFYLAIITVLAGWLYIVRRRRYHLVFQLEKQSKQRKTVFAFLNRLGERLTAQNLSIEPALEIITEFVVDATGANSGAAFLFDDEKRTLGAAVVYGMFPPLMPTTSYVLTKQKHLAERVKKERIAVGEGIIGEVASTGQPLLVLDAAADPRVPRTALELMEVRSLVVAPLKTRGQVLGVLAVANRAGQPTFDKEALDLVESLADQAASTVELVKLYGEVAQKQRIEQELKVAHDFQQMLLPKECPQVDGFVLAAYSLPAQEVGGDYFDFFWVDENERYLGVAIADVSGKGIPAALIMSVVRCTMRAVAAGNMSPKDVLMKANERVYADTKENVFVTMTYGILDTKERSFRFCRAGHEPLVTAKKDGMVRLSSPDGIAVGLVDSEIFSMLEEEVVQLEAGDTAVLYTDGVIEAMDDEANEYGQRRFFDFVAAHRDEAPTAIIESAMTDIRAFTKGYPQHDDITLLAIRVLGEGMGKVLDAPVMEGITSSIGLPPGGAASANG